MTRGSLIWLAAVLALGIAATPAHAQDALRTLSFRAEAGVAGTLPTYQRDVLDYGLGLMGALRPGWRPFAPLVIQLALESWYFPSDGAIRSPSGQPGAGQQYTLGGGIRLEPRLGDLGWIFLDANAGVALTGDLSRFTFDAGIGLEIALGRALAIGPFVRYMHTFASAAEDFPQDAQFVAGGLSIALRGREDEPATVRDRDDDGVLDPEDVCPDVPRGSDPDPQRPGCPLGDQDSDGVFDRDDVCPAIPQGEHAHPQRRGCPAADTDSDGVFDHDDACPTAPAGEHPDPARRGCPDADRDADGVYDSADRCPDQHQGFQPDPARPGCPLPDRDRDSVADAQDACPDEPGAPTTDPRTNGCPGLVRVEEGRIAILRPVFFATNRDRILSRSRSVLEGLADALRASPHLRRVRIEGHTDDVADDAYNLDLSRRRAENVRARLIELGVEAERLEAAGYGETRPLVAEQTREARAVNRRVEFHIVEGQPRAPTPAPSSPPPAPAPSPPAPGGSP